MLVQVYSMGVLLKRLGAAAAQRAAEFERLRAAAHAELQAETRARRVAAAPPAPPADAGLAGVRKKERFETVTIAPVNPPRAPQSRQE